MASSRPDQARRADLMITIGLLLLAAAVLWWWLRLSLWIFDLVLMPLSVLLAAGGIGLLFVGCRRSGRRWLGWVLVPMVAGVVVLAAPYWSAPKVWFALHRPLYDAALAVQPETGYYGSRLPAHLSVLSVNGSSSVAGGVRFFPQWVGTPDDAGGFLYSPAGPPVGFDMYGAACGAPVELGGGWWMCGL